MLGTGKMGSAMARRLASKGFEVRVWNRTRSRAEAVGAGEVFDDPAAAVDGAHVALSMLTDSKAVQDVYASVIPAAGSCVLVDLSTVSVSVHRRIAREARHHGVEFIEAPVLGSIPAVEAGKLSILAAGDKSAIERARPALECLGTVERVGEVGDAAQLKLVANAALAVTTAMAGELLTAGTAAGIEAERVWKVLVRLVPYLDMRREGFLDRVYQPVTFRVQDMAKDVDLALAEFTETRLPILTVVRNEYEAACANHADDDVAAVNEMFAQPRQGGHE